MDWLDTIFNGGKKDYSKTLDKISKREAYEKATKDVPVIGQLATPEQKITGEARSREEKNAKRIIKPAREEDSKEEQLREEDLVVIDGALIKFNAHQGIFKVLADVPTTQEKLTGTLVEKQPANFIFYDGFVLSALEDWKDFGSTKVQGNEVLIKKSKLPGVGSIPGVTTPESGNIEFITSGQINEPEILVWGTLLITSITGWDNRYTEIAREIHPTVCHEIECKAEYVNCEEDKSEAIQWKVGIKKDFSGEETEFVNLTDRIEIIGYPRNLTGSTIYFPVPEEWHNKTLIFQAFLSDEPSIESNPKSVKIKDHIIAAFYRVDNNNPQITAFNNIIKAPGTSNFFDFAPVHHHQGMYRDKQKFYISGSTGWVPAYTYIINGKDDHLGDLIFNEKYIHKYKHPGGLQSSNGILAIGLEEYAYLGAYVKGNSVVCFFDTNSNTEIKNLRIIRDEKYGTEEYPSSIPHMSIYKYKDQQTELKFKETNPSDSDLASAVGIVYHDHKWTVAVRGDNQSVDIYEINSTKTEVIKKARFEKVGEFQNLNLLIDEKEEIYMLGMADGEKCSMYRLNVKDKCYLEAVWILNGTLKYRSYEEENARNCIIFGCKKPASFHWASCVYLETDKNHSKYSGFSGKFTVYAIGDKVENGSIVCNYFTEKD
ncbi:hypothetical protein [Apibacter sp. HY039]|uniref:hypothetical protein n=1 Tax=Apibacter sp. HY039 TaxID=2501476 RepID=UPI000FEBBC7C|nr:hypothetical protein [Apibacter sp. HY039]